MPYNFIGVDISQLYNINNETQGVTSGSNNDWIYMYKLQLCYKLIIEVM